MLLILTLVNGDIYLFLYIIFISKIMILGIILIKKLHYKSGPISKLYIIKKGRTTSIYP